jgi:hypothetical protein
VKNGRAILFWILIAMWFWAVAASGETLPVTKEMLVQGNYAVALLLPCNWDKNLDNISSTAVYAHPGEYTDVQSFSILDRDSVINVPIAPVSTTADVNNLYVAFDPKLEMMHDGKYLYHINVEVGTTGAVCKQGFGFGFGTRPRR